MLQSGYFFTVQESVALNIGSLLSLVSALLNATYKVTLDRLSKEEEGFLVSMIQLAVVALHGLTAMLRFEKPTLSQRKEQWWQL